MSDVDGAMHRAQMRFLRQDYDKQVVAQGGSGAGQGYEMCGAPQWDRVSWDRFRVQFGRWPYSAQELPPSFAGAPPWVYELLNLRQPPVGVSGGADYWGQ